MHELGMYLRAWWKKQIEFASNNHNNSRYSFLQRFKYIANVISTNCRNTKFITFLFIEMEKIIHQDANSFFVIF